VVVRRSQIGRSTQKLLEPRSGDNPSNSHCALSRPSVSARTFFSLDCRQQLATFQAKWF
jgi:hypothetical protein